MHVKPQREHEWLHRLVGEWTYETTAANPAQAGQPAEKASGTEHVRSIGGLWVVAEGQGEMPGAGKATSIMTLGYDPAKRRFVGTWVGSMMANLWVYDGELDPSGNKLTLNSEGPSMSGDGTTAKYQDIIEFKSSDRRTLTGQAIGPDGRWVAFMTVEYTRRK
jgi:hypothetical protein